MCNCATHHRGCANRGQKGIDNGRYNLEFPICNFSSCNTIFLLPFAQMDYLNEIKGNVFISGLKIHETVPFAQMDYLN